MYVPFPLVQDPLAATSEEVSALSESQPIFDLSYKCCFVNNSTTFFAGDPSASQRPHQ